MDTDITSRMVGGPTRITDHSGRDIEIGKKSKIGALNTPSHA